MGKIEPKVVSLASPGAPVGGGDQIVDLRPASGKRWIVIDAWGWHDDTVARALNWQYYDGTTTIAKSPTTRDANVQVPLSFDVGAFGSIMVPSRIILTNSVYAQFKGASLAEGKKVYVQALVLEMTS